MAKKVPKTTTLHGVTLTDEYGWLREKGTPEVTAYLEAENAYTEAGTAHTAALRETLYNELLGRIKESDQDVPARDGEYWYYTRTEEGKAYPVFCRKKGTLEAAEEVYLDQNALADGKKFHALGGMDVSPDGTTLLYLEDLTAFREYTLHVKDLSTGRILGIDLRRVERHGVGGRQPDVLLHARRRGKAWQHHLAACPGYAA